MTDINRENLISQLREAVIQGEAVRVAQIQDDLTNLKTASIGNNAAALRETIKGIDKRLAEIKEEELAITAEKAERNKKYLKAYDAYRDALAAVQACDIALFACDAERTNLHGTKYQASTELQTLSEKAAQRFEEEN